MGLLIRTESYQVALERPLKRRFSCTFRKLWDSLPFKDLNQMRLRFLQSGCNNSIQNSHKIQIFCQLNNIQQTPASMNSSHSNHSALRRSLAYLTVVINGNSNPLVQITQVAVDWVTWPPSSTIRWIHRMQYAASWPNTWHQTRWWSRLSKRNIHPVCKTTMLILQAISSRLGSRCPCCLQWKRNSPSASKKAAKWLPTRDFFVLRPTRKPQTWACLAKFFTKNAMSTKLSKTSLRSFDAKLNKNMKFPQPKALFLSVICFEIKCEKKSNRRSRMKVDN